LKKRQGNTVQDVGNGVSMTFIGTKRTAVGRLGCRDCTALFFSSAEAVCDVMTYGVTIERQQVIVETWARNLHHGHWRMRVQSAACNDGS